MQIHESGENYLETILMLEEKNGNVRSIDVANELGFSKPSISRAMGILKSGELIEIDEIGHIHLTSKGRAAAERVYERHRLITRYLHEVLGVDSDTAAKDACRIEHVISSQTFQKIKSSLL